MVRYTIQKSFDEKTKEPVYKWSYWRDDLEIIELETWRGKYTIPYPLPDFSQDNTFISKCHIVLLWTQCWQSSGYHYLHPITRGWVEEFDEQDIIDWIGKTEPIKDAVQNQKDRVELEIMCNELAS